MGVVFETLGGQGKENQFRCISTMIDKGHITVYTVSGNTIEGTTEIETIGICPAGRAVGGLFLYYVVKRSNRGLPVITANFPNIEPTIYLIFVQGDNMRSPAKISTLKGHEAKLFDSGRTTCLQKAAIFCFEKDGDVLCVTEGGCKRYFVCHSGLPIQDMDERGFNENSFNQRCYGAGPRIWTDVV
ncbi:hypothetical protein IKF73_03335 [Candidatus Saccharibacteria bacterium]|nr:hypothetical protein [Candidatus Saccharibacteria bacterium]